MKLKLDEQAISKAAVFYHIFYSQTRASIELYDLKVSSDIQKKVIGKQTLKVHPWAKEENKCLVKAPTWHGGTCTEAVRGLLFWTLSLGYSI